VTCPTFDRERSPERHLVYQADRRDGTSELEAAGNGGAKEIATGPKLGPACRVETLRQHVVTVVLPPAELRPPGGPVLAVDILEWRSWDTSAMT